MMLQEEVSEFGHQRSAFRKLLFVVAPLLSGLVSHFLVSFVNSRADPAASPARTSPRGSRTGQFHFTNSISPGFQVLSNHDWSGP
jgi:hypothetical protein